MNIKSLLLGSAAALVAVSGARAADAVVMAEPEPMEYVRVCDMYGAGFFYIPGTETCLKIGGYIRAEIGGGELFDSPTDSYSTLLRFAPNFTAKNETEYGTLTGYGEVEFNYGNGGNDLLAGGPLDLDGDGDNDIDADTGVALASAYIDLAGFRIGKGDSQFLAFVPAGPGLGFGGVMSDDLVSTGADTTSYINYNFDLAGFQAVVSVEEGIANDELLSYVPHVVGGLAYDGGVFRVSAVAAYDANNEEFAGKAKITGKINDSFGLWVMGGYKTDDGDDEDDSLGPDNDGTNFYGDWRGGDCDEANNGNCGDGYAVWAGATYIYSPTVQFSTQVSYDEGEDFAAAVDVALTPVTGFAVTAEVAYTDNFDEDNFGDDNDAFGGKLRFQRNF